VFGLLLLALLIFFPVVSWAQEPTIEAPESAGNEPSTTHIVQEGDTLFDIAIQYNTTVATLLYLNNLTEESLIVPGQQLNIADVFPHATPIPDPVNADPTIPKIHIVQAGDSLFSIAELYQISFDDLLRVNHLNPDDVLPVGYELLVPGIAGAVVVFVYTVEYGDTLAKLAARFGTTVEAILGENGLINPDYLVAGQKLTISSYTGSTEPYLLTGSTYFTNVTDVPLLVSAKMGMSPVTLEQLNDPLDMRSLQTGTRLLVAGTNPFRYPPNGWIELDISSPLQQGRAFVIRAESERAGKITGQISQANTYSQTIEFIQDAESQVAIVGLDAFVESGVYTLLLDDGMGTTFEQDIFVADGGFGQQQIEVGEELSGLLDYSLREAEDNYLGGFYSNYTPERRWEGLFNLPVAQNTISADYGDARSYNGGPYLTFHSGIDYAAPQGAPVVAPAAGVVILSELTVVHGQMIIVDHGMGVTTSYSHLDQSVVNVGDFVTSGQLIGLVGTSGLSSGYHLHWEVRILDVPINPMQWLEDEFP
jgi:murein DD-endopeptidase MepM/ murein hydrolase activator NlpD